MKLSHIYPCGDTSDVTPLYPIIGLYLKPMSRLNMTIHFPQLKESIPFGGTNVSSWAIMEKLKALVAPDNFISIKTVKNSLEFIRFEGDFENRNVLKSVIGRLDGKKLKVTGIKEPLKILCAETKLSFPSKYDWDSYFRDARGMDDLKAGERPDTIHIQNLPIQWFAIPKDKVVEKEEVVEQPPAVPSERIFRRVWEGFGEIRTIDIPMLDPYRSRIKTSLRGIKTFTFTLDKVFEAYIQYKEYLGFVKAMDALRSAFLAHKDNDKFYVTAIKVDFDKTKHLSEDSIKQRKLEVDKIRIKEVSTGKYVGKIIKKGGKTEEGESIGNGKSSKANVKDVLDMDRKIAMEERKYLVARRKLEAIRLLDFLFERLKAKKIMKEQEEERKRKKREQKRKRGGAVRDGEMAEMKSRSDELKERVLAARHRRPEEARRHEIAARSVKRALHGGRSNYNRTIHVNPQILRPRQGHTADYVRDFQTPPQYSPQPVYGSQRADRAYERYFKSLSRRKN